MEAAGVDQRGLARDGMARRADALIEVGLKRVRSEGTTALLLSPVELCEQLAAIIPPARANQVIYGGVPAAHASWRKEVVPTSPKEPRRTTLSRIQTPVIADDPPGWSSRPG